MNAQHIFIDFAASYGLCIDSLIDDGELHRVPVEGDKRGKTSGSYTFHSNGVVSGFVENFKTGKRSNWSSKEASLLTDKQRREQHQQIQYKKPQKALQTQASYDAVAKHCQSQWQQFTEATNDHAYLQAKGVQAFGLRCDNNRLLVPLRNSQGELRAWQSITPNGDKLFVKGGRKKGHYHAIGNPTEVIYICEGYATGATIHTLTGHFVAVAFDANNLLPVAEQIKAKYPSITLVIAADNDHTKEHNIGLEKATQVASKLGIKLVTPTFEKHQQGSDFNDMASINTEDTKALLLGVLEQPTNEPTEDDKEIDRLARLNKLDYERQREASAKALGINRVSALDAEVKARQRQIQAQEQGNELEKGIEPWPYPVHGDQLAQEIKALFDQHCVLPNGAAVALTVWCMATYTINAFRIFPKLCLSSPEKRCGKTTTMEVIGALVCKQLNASNITPAAIFRTIDLWQPTLLVDEADTFLAGNEEMRGIINSGHRKSGAYVLRVDGEGSAMKPRQFSTWSPMAIAMIKTPPDTIIDRSIMVTLRRKQQSEAIKRLPIEPLQAWAEIRQKCQRWYNDHQETLQTMLPSIPSVGNDRAEDNWLPLLAISELLGGQWSALTSAAMITIESSKPKDDESAGVMVLSDIRQVFNDKNLDSISSQELVDHLVEIEDRPWCEWKRGQPMTKRSLANLLRYFDVTPEQYRERYGIKRGYKIEQFTDAFNRYLPDTLICSGTTVHKAESLI